MILFFPPVPPRSELLERKHTHPLFFIYIFIDPLFSKQRIFLKGEKAVGGEGRIILKTTLLGAGCSSVRETISVSRQSKHPCLKSTFVHDGKLVHGGCVFSKAHFIKTPEEDRHNNACKATGREAQRQTQYNCGLGVCAIGQHGRRSVWVVWCGFCLFVFVVVFFSLQ